jgi:uncharacterized MAPEG superfamily protein
VTPDLKYLVLSAILTLAQMLVALLLAFLRVGLPMLAGNREGMPTLTGVAGRAQRAHRNALENLVLLAILVLVAHVAGRSNTVTATGAMLFFWARLAHWLIYLAGVAWLRTVAFVVSVAGLLIVASQLF